MQVTKEQAFKKIKELVERFSEHIEEYKRNRYNEHQTRVDYINPFFKALGWDMDNRQGHAEAYREVIHEDKIKVGSATKAPDYGFTLYGQRKFFVDAKKPSVNIKGDIAPAYQVRRYGWSAKVPISIVTDFEEFSIYDCTKKPKTTDKASVSRIKYLTYCQYLDEFDFIWDVFAKENLPKGRFDKYVQSDTSKKGTATVDDEFLKSIEEWRRYLATTIALRNKLLNEDEINYAVQKTIDRIIFLRMCEDRGVEQYGELKKAAEKGDIYENLFRLFRIADDKYNSGLFDFKEDKITPNLKIDNKVLKTISKELYYPNCEYEFSVMPADILGSVYERFLGKTIRLTKAHSAKIEEKPEVRKAGGVYYTPKYVVDYIVQNTVGKIIEGKTPKQVEKIKICDPACGSGSFLIGAYKHLLDWHLQYYTDNPPGRKKGSPFTPDGNLTTAEKKRILLNNIFGVDIDAQAVEVTKLNLLLKALEGETKASISYQTQLFHERVLPNLNQNIKCGNSLIGSDFYDNQLDLFPEQMKKINAFDWKQGFPDIFKQGGFDMIIGNPPYGIPLSKEEVTYLSNKFPQAKKISDSYCLFMILAKHISKPNGLFSYIVPNTFCDLESCNDFRNWLLTENVLKEIWQSGWTFKAAVVDTLVFLMVNKKAHEKNSDDLISIKVDDRIYSRKVSSFLDNHLLKIDYRNSGTDKALLDKIHGLPSLSKFAQVKAGVKMYEKGKGNPAQTAQTMKERPFSTKNGQPEGWKKLYRGQDISRYVIAPPREYVDYGPWLAAPRSSELFESPKILMRRTDDRLLSCIEFENSICVNSCHVIKLHEEITKSLSYEYLLGLLNSSLLQRIFEIQNPQMVGKVFAEIKVIYVERLPIKPIDISNSKEKEKHDQVVSLVNSLLKLNRQITETKLETQRQQIQRTIDHSERKINELVYGLYGLGKEEI